MINLESELSTKTSSVLDFKKCKMIITVNSVAVDPLAH